MNMILALESSCDDTCAAVLGADGRLRSNVISSQGVHDRFGGVVPEIASRQHLEADQPRRRAGVERGGYDARADRGSGSYAGAGACGGVAGWVCPPERLWPRPVSCRSRRSIICRGTSRRTSSIGVRTAVPLPDRQRRAHAAGARAPSTTDTRCSAARSTTRRGRRSTRGRGCSGWDTRAAPRWSVWPPREIPRHSPSQARAASAPVAGGGRAGRHLRGASTSPSPG